MNKRRVVITGTGCVSPLGRGSDILFNALKAGKSGLSLNDEFLAVEGLRSGVCARVEDVNSREIPRKARRSMSRSSIYATLATMDALRQAGQESSDFDNDRSGIAVGSTISSGETLEGIFSSYLEKRSVEHLMSAAFFKVMSHSCASNIAASLNIGGRIMGLASACATSNQTIGFAYEQILGHRIERCIAGGADELHALTMGVFDVINAAACGYNDRPELASKPFDKDRCGICCGEGAGIVILESLESALDRSAPILAEIVGFGSITDTSSFAHPNPDMMERCMRLALVDAGIEADQIDYVNAHATATVDGDAAELTAIRNLFQDSTPVSSMKGHIGHTMAACGAIELIAAINMMREGILVATRNLKTPDPVAGDLNLLRLNTPGEVKYFLKNNFAFGGINSTIVVKQYDHD